MHMTAKMLFEVNRAVFESKLNQNHRNFVNLIEPVIEVFCRRLSRPCRGQRMQHVAASLFRALLEDTFEYAKGWGSFVFLFIL